MNTLDDYIEVLKQGGWAPSPTAVDSTWLRPKDPYRGRVPSILIVWSLTNKVAYLYRHRRIGSEWDHRIILHGNKGPSQGSKGPKRLARFVTGWTGGIYKSQMGSI